MKHTFVFLWLCSILCVFSLYAQNVPFSPKDETARLKSSLHLTQQQTDKVFLILQDTKEDITEISASLKNKPEELEFALDETIANAQKKIAALLSEEQAQKFKEINLFERLKHQEPSK
ncbi:MAG: hypothetical protein KBG83_02990 [Bacteroidetes bacterium]|nr:hypothetical protein [Bacteroidota bacterium]